MFQIAPCSTLEGNLEKGIASCRKAKELGAGIALFPEMWSATCNYPDSVPDCNGGSSIFDGVAYLPDMDGSRDTCILQADGTEGVYLAELDLEQLRHYREHEVHGNAFQRPQKYGLLLDTKIEPPFIRNKYRKR